MMNRRNMLNLLVAAAAGAAVSPAISFADNASKKRRLPWRNWSGSQKCLPEFRTAPATVAELQELIAKSAGTIRTVGAGHSFTPLVPTEGTILSMSKMSGVISSDPDTLRSKVWAGSRIGSLGGPLEAAGQALINMPDIDEQSLAGCLATATHGTGAEIGCMSTFVTGLEFVNAQGELVTCSENHNKEVFEAAKVSLGSLGVITQVELQNIEPYRLRREAVWRDIDEIFEIAESLADNHRNFEFYYVPFSGAGFTDVHDFTSEPFGATEKIDANEGVESLRKVRDALENWPMLRELILGTVLKGTDPEITVEKSWKNYASERNVRFNEMEYHLPREHGIQAMREIKEALEKNHREVFFPIEVRFVKGDDIWLSPFYQQDTCSIAVHRYYEEDFKPFFKTIEPIFRKYNGRPHWGKLNTLTQADFKNLYPKWNDFQEVRRELDPQGRFLNSYLQSLFT